MTRKFLATILSVALVMSSFMFIPAPAEAAITHLKTADTVTLLPTYTFGETITGRAVAGNRVRLDVMPFLGHANPAVAWSNVVGSPAIFTLNTGSYGPEGEYQLREVSPGVDTVWFTADDVTVDTVSVYLRYVFTLTSPVSYAAHPSTARIVTGRVTWADGWGVPGVNIWLYGPAAGLPAFQTTTGVAGDFTFPYVFTHSGTYTIRVSDAYLPDAPVATANVYATISVSAGGLVITPMIVPHQLYWTGAATAQEMFFYVADATGAAITTGLSATLVSGPFAPAALVNLNTPFAAGAYQLTGTTSGVGLLVFRIFTTWAEAFYTIPVVQTEIFNPSLRFSNVPGDWNLPLRVVNSTVATNAARLHVDMLTPSLTGYTEQTTLRTVTISGPVTATTITAGTVFDLFPRMAGEIRVRVDSHFWTTGSALTAQCLHYSREFSILPNPFVNDSGVLRPATLVATVLTPSFTVDQVADISVQVLTTAGVQINNASIRLTGSVANMFRLADGTITNIINIDAVTANTNIINGVYTALGVTFRLAGTIQVEVLGGGVPPLPTTVLQAFIPAPITVSRKIVPVTITPAGKRLVVGLEDNFSVTGVPTTGVGAMTVSDGVTVASHGLAETLLLDGSRLINVYPARHNTRTLTLRWDSTDLTTRHQVTIEVLAPRVVISAPHTDGLLTRGYTEAVSFVIRNPITDAIMIPSTLSVTYTFDTCNLQRSNAGTVVTFFDHASNRITLDGLFGNPNAVGAPVINFRFTRAASSAYTLFTLEVRPPMITVLPATIPFGAETFVTLRARDAHGLSMGAGNYIELEVGTPPSIWLMPLGYTNADGVVSFMAFRAPFILPSIARYHVYMNGGLAGTFDVVPAPAPTITASATPASIVRGASTTLTWASTNATSVNIFPGIGATPLSGSLTLSPTATTTYVVTAVGPGGTVTSNVVVTVTDPPVVPAPRVVELRIGSTFYKVDGVTLIMDAPPFVENGRTMVPVRFLVTGLGGTVEWDGETRTVVVRFTRPVLHIRLVIGEPVAVVGTTIVPIDEDPSVVPVIVGGRTFVPLRFLLERITGSSIEWVPPDVVIMRLPR